MTSALEGLFKQHLQKTESQSFFSLWWENMEDKLLYMIVIMGEQISSFN